MSGSLTQEQVEHLLTWHDRYETDPAATVSVIAAAVWTTFSIVNNRVRRLGWKPLPEVRMARISAGHLLRRINPLRPMPATKAPAVPHNAAPSVWSHAAGIHVSTQLCGGRHIVVRHD